MASKTCHLALRMAHQGWHIKRKGGGWHKQNKCTLQNSSPPAPPRKHRPRPLPPIASNAPATTQPRPSPSSPPPSTLTLRRPRPPRRRRRCTLQNSSPQRQTPHRICDRVLQHVLTAFHRGPPLGLRCVAQTVVFATSPRNPDQGQPPARTLCARRGRLWRVFPPQPQKTPPHP